MEHVFAVASHFMWAFSQAACVLGSASKGRRGNCVRSGLKATIDSKGSHGVSSGCKLHCNKSTKEGTLEPQPVVTARISRSVILSRGSYPVLCKVTASEKDTPKPRDVRR